MMRLQEFCERLKGERLLRGISRPELSMPARPQYRCLLGAVQILLGYLLPPALLLSLCTAALGGDSSQLPGNLRDVLEVMGYIMALGWITKKIRKRKEKNFFQATNLKPRRFAPRFMLLLVLAGLCFGLAVSALLGLLPLSEGVMDAYESGTMEHFTGSSAFMGVFIVGIFSPIAEELVFRGFLMGNLREGFSDVFALCLSALLFGLMHVQPVWIVYAACMGLVLGWAALRMENLLASILIHFGFNAAGLLILAMPDGSLAARVTGYPLTLLLCLPAGLLGALLLTDRVLAEYDRSRAAEAEPSEENCDGEA